MSIFDRLFGLDRVAPHDAEAMELLITTQSNEQLAAVEALLRVAEMPYRLADRGAGGIVRVVTGNNIYGTDVFVRTEDLETARELLAPADVEESGESEEQA